MRNRTRKRKKHYRQLTLDERAAIAHMKDSGMKQNEIAERMKRDPSTICRELSRNAPPIHVNYYVAHKAQERYEARISMAHQREPLKNDVIRRYVAQRLRDNWTPEEIAGRLPKEHRMQHISHEAIYQYIYKIKPEFIRYLAFSHRKRKYHGQGKRHKTSHIPNRVPISERPLIVNSRRSRGHWEADTMVSRASGRTLVTLCERKTKAVIIVRVKNNTADAVSNAIIMRLRGLPKWLRRTITYDNGHENVLHEKVNRALGMKSYFCAPYHSWEKGTVENTNGLIRRYLPKKTDFGRISNRRIQCIEAALNNRPRKCLRYKTPLEALETQIALAA